MNKKTYIYIAIAFFLGILASCAFNYSQKYLQRGKNSSQELAQPNQPTYNQQTQTDTTTTTTKPTGYPNTYPNTQNSQNTNSQTMTQLVEKCSPSYNYRKNFGVKVCLLLPQNWRQQALGYEDHIVFKEDIYTSEASPTVTINRHDSTKYTSFDAYLNKNDEALIEKYHGEILQKDKGNNYYYLETKLQYNNQPIYAFAYYYNDTAHGYFWSTTLMLTPEQYAKYQSIAPTMVRSFRVWNAN